MLLGFGKLVEQALAQQVIEPASRTATSTLFNGQTATNGYAIDRQGFDEVVVILNSGVIPAGATLNASIYEGDTDNTALAAAVTGTAITEVTNANDQAIQVVSLDARGLKRYLWLRTVYNATGVAGFFSATALKAKPNTAPVSATLVTVDV